MKFVILALFISLAACSSNSSSSNRENNNTDNTNNGSGEQTEETTQATSQMYSIKFTALWNEIDHLAAPGNAHFSPIVTATHTEEYSLFPKGEEAGAGFQRVAELGQTSIINSEISNAQSQGLISSSINTENQFFVRDGILEQEFFITATKDHPLFSFITMIAPSPDWVVGVSGVELYNANGFISEAIEQDLFAYQAGTQEGDVGGNFSLGQIATNPKGVVSRLSGAGFNAPFARVVITPIN